MGVGGQRQDPAALTLGKTQYSLHRRLGGPQGRSGLARATLSLLEFEIRTVCLYRMTCQVIQKSGFFIVLPVV